MGEKELTQMKINLPAEIKAWLAAEAAKNLRSQSAEIIFALKEKMEHQAKRKG